MRQLKNTIMPLFGRREEVLRRFGTIRNFYLLCLPEISHCLRSQQYFAEVIDNRPCTEEQSACVQKCIELYLDRPKAIITALRRGKRLSEEEIDLMEKVLRLNGREDQQGAQDSTNEGQVVP